MTRSTFLGGGGQCFSCFCVALSIPRRSWRWARVDFLSWKCRRHVASCRHDTTCRSNFGQMGPCRRHKIEDVVAVCVGSSQHFPDFPKCVCRNILWYGSTNAQILSPTHIMLTIQLHNEFSAPQHHPPMPPTKAMGAITQNHRGHTTATP
jgi:hypothetical protein